MEERLDRAMATQRWLSLFDPICVHNLNTFTSDHSALFLDFLEEKVTKHRRFRFENAWVKEEDCKSLVVNSWNWCWQNDVQEKIAKCGKDLQVWGEKKRMQFKNKIKECRSRSRIKVLKFRRDEESVRKLKETNNELSTLLNQQEMYWRQRAKQFWLVEGDSNTKFFHQFASARKQKNSIVRLQDDHGQWQSWNAGLEDMIKSYFTDIFTSRGCEGGDIFNCVQSKVTEIQNQELIRLFEAMEIKEALFAMHPDKAPGPNGMNPGFYQQFWDIVGEDVTNACLHNLNNAFIPSGLNSTIIVLVPKTKKPVKMTELRPIALCNVIYKIMAKAIANRLKKILPMIISESQSAFVEGRSIMDNILVAFEVNHYLKRKTQGRKGVAALKIDMSKAYDRIEWLFLRRMMQALGFDEAWIELVMVCITSVEYKVIQDGCEVGPIVPGRGLRQGDPISPYLFIMCVEGLSSLLRKYELRGLIHGCKVARNAPMISHLFFADDSFLFF